MTCMNDWWAFYFSCTIWLWRFYSVVRHFELTLDLESSFDFALTMEEVLRVWDWG
jgi:hypothetical protein